MTEHIELESSRTPEGVPLARCSCGWRQAPPSWDSLAPPPRSTFQYHRDEALRPAENQCRYCAGRIPWRQAFCADSCRRADARSLDARAEVLAAHRDDDPPEPILPGPDQIEMFP